MREKRGDQKEVEEVENVNGIKRGDIRVYRARGQIIDNNTTVAVPLNVARPNDK